MSRKRGKLSLADMAFIDEHSSLMDVESIAERLNRTVTPIEKYIEQRNLEKNDMNDQDFLIKKLRDRYYYPEIRRQLDDDEIVRFEFKWVEYVKQFNEDVLPTEEQQILELIRSDVLIDRVIRGHKDIEKEIRRLNTLIDAEMDKDATMRDVNLLSLWQNQLGQQIASKGTYISEYDKLLGKNKDLNRALKATREQRMQRANDSKTNFSAWLRHLEDEDVRKRQGSLMEKMRIASDKSLDKLSEWHEYSDKMVDQPILNCDSVKSEDD